MDLNITGKKALVTGSTKGIGLATAQGLARMGADVIIHGRAGVEETVASMAAAFPDIHVTGVAVDLAEAEGPARIAHAVPEVDVLVNNAGVYFYRDFLEISEQDLKYMFDLNVFSALRLVQIYLPRMLANGWGRIVNIASEAGVFVPPDMIHYGMAKAAQLAFSRGVAELTAGSDVTVNAVLPGPTLVDTTREMIRRRADERGTDDETVMRDTFAVRRPTSLLKRYATPDEVANMICYLCSPAAAATNGAPLRVDGGIIRNFA